MDYKEAKHSSIFVTKLADTYKLKQLLSDQLGDVKVNP